MHSPAHQACGCLTVPHTRPSGTLLAGLTSEVRALAAETGLKHSFPSPSDCTPAPWLFLERQPVVAGPLQASSSSPLALLTVRQSWEPAVGSSGLHRRTTGRDSHILHLTRRDQGCACVTRSWL